MMKLFKRFFSLALACFMLLGVFVACDNGGEVDDTSSVDPDGDIVDNTTAEDTTEEETTAEETTTAPVILKGYEGYTEGMKGKGKKIAIGLDISEHQGENFNFNAVKAAGYSFVILRCGFGTHPTKSPRRDYHFEANYKAARAAGLDIGVYFYSYANNVTQAKQELALFLEYIEGKKFEYPVYYDFENSDCKSNMGSNATTARIICKTVLDGLADAGYLAGLYSYASWADPSFNGWISGSVNTLGKQYDFWMANYSKNDGTVNVDNAKRYSTMYGMHQYTSKCRINGYNGNLDANICFKDYPAIVRAYGFNGYEAEGVENVKFKTGVAVDAPFVEDYDLDTTKAGKYIVNSNSSLNIRSGPAATYTTIGALDRGTEITIHGVYKGWARFDYKDGYGWVTLSSLKSAG